MPCPFDNPWKILHLPLVNQPPWLQQPEFRVLGSQTTGLEKGPLLLLPTLPNKRHPFQQLKMVMAASSPQSGSWQKPCVPFLVCKDFHAEHKSCFKQSRAPTSCRFCTLGATAKTLLSIRRTWSKNADARQKNTRRTINESPDHYGLRVTERQTEKIFCFIRNNTLPIIIIIIAKALSSTRTLFFPFCTDGGSQFPLTV